MGDDGAEEGPAWIGEAIAQMVYELRTFSETALAFARHPRTFADQWYRGERRAMNPLGCLAAAAAIILPIQSVFGVLIPGPHPYTPLSLVLSIVAPYLHYAALGAISHPLLRNAGSRRTLSGSIGVSLFAGTLPGLGGSLLVTLSGAIFYASGERARRIEEPFITLIVLATFLFFFAIACAGLAGLHRVRWPRAFLALTCAFLVTGFLFGYFDPPGQYGLHLRATPGKTWPSFDIGVVI